ncbi:MAG: acetylxylan esterase [Candidatus Symbiothrix sp.]|jgi:cephalosporin-C deacetylase-like acetyl esterase|nr:acetylxylan esterase [Candidatus Symbiothrix sp.]
MKNIFYLLFSIILFAACCNQTERVDAVISQSFSDEWKFNAGKGDSAHWESPGFDDSAWAIVSGNKFLKDQEKTLENGFGWYRKTVGLSDSLQKSIQDAGAAIIHLGKFAATEEIYLNGKLVGKTGDFPDNYMGFHGEERHYVVPAEDFSPDSKNLIAIKFHDGWSIGGFMDDTDLSISSALTKDKLSMTVTVNDEDYIFLAPHPIEIKVAIDNKNRWPVNGKLIVNLTTDDYQPVQRDSNDIKIKPNQNYTHSFQLANPNPGFYRYSVSFIESEEIACEKKFNVGYEPEKIVSPLDNHADFKAFWDNNLAELKKVAPNYKLTLVPEFSTLDYNIYLVEMKSFGNELIRGYYGQPKKEGKYPVIIEYMGYGSKPYPPTQTYDGFAYFVLSIRGQALNEPTNHFGTWITYGLDNKENYYYRGAFCDVVRAIDFVCSRPAVDAEKIAVRGGSQGGALSYVAAALDKRVKVAAPNIPFLSDYPDYFKITHWPRSDFEYYLQQHPEANWEEIYALLTYFDIKNLAQWIECPVIMGIGVQDDVCPPHTNFAAYNQVKSAKRWMAFPEYGHSVGKEFYDESMVLFKKELNIEK